MAAGYWKKFQYDGGWSVTAALALVMGAIGTFSGVYVYSERTTESGTGGDQVAAVAGAEVESKIQSLAVRDAAVVDDLARLKTASALLLVQPGSDGTPTAAMNKVAAKAESEKKDIHQEYTRLISSIAADPRLAEDQSQNLMGRAHAAIAASPKTYHNGYFNTGYLQECRVRFNDADIDARAKKIAACTQEDHGSPVLTGLASGAGSGILLTHGMYLLAFGGDITRRRREEKKKDPNAPQRFIVKSTVTRIDD